MAQGVELLLVTWASQIGVPAHVLAVLFPSQSTADAHRKAADVPSAGAPATHGVEQQEASGS